MGEVGMLNKSLHSLILLLAFAAFGLIAEGSHAAEHKVLVVMSYEESFPWCRDIKDGIDFVLGGSCKLRYSYMNTKTCFEGGPQKAMEAYAVYQEFKPDGVIAADDNAQSMFVVPYLKDKVKTPVIFCGVGAEPELYGYPASNVSGVLERHFFGETLAFAQQLIPGIKSASFMMKKDPSSKNVLNWIEKTRHTYPVPIVATAEPETVENALETARGFKENSDVLLIVTLQGLTDAKGHPLEEKDIIPVLSNAFGKPLLASNAFVVRLGALCSVVETGQEQGKQAAKLLMEAMREGTVSQIPITRNKYGKRIINVTVLKQWGIVPKPHVLRGAELVRSEE